MNKDFGQQFVKAIKFISQ